ncbi:hypothetical protein G9A89_010790 [Geosiphon pyriformis]|nr:hypothetical protein G9A89_010790 [Geosiphon pyriformis]
MPCDNKWCPECYALSISLLSKNDQEKIEFGEHKPEKESTTTPIYLIENQPAIQLKYFDNNGKNIKPEKAYEIDAGYDLRYSGKDTLSNSTNCFLIIIGKQKNQSIYLLLINILGLQLVNNREQLGKSERGTQGFALNTQNEFHQIL